MEEMQIDYVHSEPMQKSRTGFDSAPGRTLSFVPGSGFSHETSPTSIQDLLLYPLHDGPTILNSPLEKMTDSWEVMCQQAQEFAQKYGHIHPPSDGEHTGLKDWLNRQILNKRHLSESQFRKLDILGVNWETAMSRDHNWEIMFTRLKAFNKEFGHCRVPAQWACDRQLALWVMRQKKTYAQGSILQDRKRLLNSIGFTWQVKELYNTQWENFFQQLVSFKKTHGHCNVPGRETKLVSWLERQRLLRKKKLLPPERENRLNQLKFIWEFSDIKSAAWDEKYKQLSAFKQEYGHSFVPLNYKENKALGIWVATQRKLEASNKLPKARLRKLEELNFVWGRDTQSKLKSEYDAQWEVSYEKLSAYKKSYGTCQVSLKVDPLLQSWAVWQRKTYYEGKMPSHRIARLNEISFPWSINEGYWVKMFGMLAEFHNTFGHTQVPSEWSENPRLAAWVYRIKFNKNDLSTEKIDSLNSLGFEWHLKRKTRTDWMSMYRRLLAFKTENGHTRLPVNWLNDPKLAKWASRMRHERAVMDRGRFARLEAIGFYWGKS